MKKVLILTNSSVGLFAFRNELVLELVKKYDVTVTFPDDEHEEELKQEGCKIIKTPINRRGVNPIEDMKLFFTYMKLLKSIKPDVVLTYTIKPNVYGGLACSLKRIPYMTNITGLGAALINPGILQVITKLLYKIGLKRVKTVFLQNQVNYDFFKNSRLTKAEMVLLPGSGVNTDRFSLLPWPKDSTEFIFIARIMKEKGIEEYLTCAEEIRKDYPNAVFNIVGPCQEHYEKQLAEANEAGIIRYHGSVKDVRPFLEKVKCIIHPSCSEGMSNVCLEAAASGRVVITTDSPGCIETVKDGETGFVFETKNAEKLIEAVRAFLELSDEDAKQMGLAGRSFVKENFDRAIVVNEYLSRIEQMVD